MVYRVNIPSENDISRVPSIHPANVETVASYNWVVGAHGDHKRILVPGYPPCWNPQSEKTPIEKDGGFRFIDQNNYFSPTAPHTPTLRAVSTCRPDINLNSINFITDRSNLVKLYKLISGHVPQAYFGPDSCKQEPELRIDVEVIGNSLLLSRWEPRSSQVLDDTQYQGFSDNFANMFTRYPDPAPGLGTDARSQGHHRVLAYVLGGHRFMVRYQADACAEAVEELRNMCGGDKSASGLEGSMSGMSISRNPTSPYDIPVRKTPNQIHPHSSIIGIKCISSRKAIDLSRSLPQAFFSQTRQLFVGPHLSGKIKRIQKFDLAAPLTDWERENESSVKKMVVMLEKIRKVVNGIKGKRAAVIFDWEKRGDGVRIYARNDVDVGLPRDLVERWGY
ncbi:hypothetical protein HOY82DRAFT_312735 [Tuber indicum]|nr:hypothetical protein HOY82DRAFT_312735 [Tuber indicum]